MRYHNITKEDMLNGDGLRVVLWVSGCEHACKGCHNAITWDENSGIEFDENAKNEIFEELDKDYISGITFSGGDPLYPANRQEITKLITEIKGKYPLKTIWLYTGYVWEEISSLTLLECVDVVADGKYDENLKDLSEHWKGSTNQRVIDVLATRAFNKIVLND